MFIIFLFILFTNNSSCLNKNDELLETIWEHERERERERERKKKGSLIIKLVKATQSPS
jgi:hypothetical protein